MEFVTYKRFYEKDIVAGLTQVLTDNGIEFQVVEDRENLDSLYGDKQFANQVAVKIRPADFAKADAVLLKMTETQLDSVEKDHYLFEFTDEELFDILSKPDEWNEFDYQLAKRILKERGKEINTETVDLLKKQRIKELAKPEESQRTLIYAGYIFALLGGLIGVFIGWYLSTFKKTLPNGQRMYGYTKEDRRNGTRIMILGIIMFIVWLTVRTLRYGF